MVKRACLGCNGGVFLPAAGEANRRLAFLALPIR
jgi:hypothetical protein